MSTFGMTSNSESAQWLIFIGILLAIGLGIACFILWLFVIRKSGGTKRKRRRNHKHRRLNPTLAQTGGLPPVRNPGEPPRGA